MNEQEWDKCNNPRRLLYHLVGGSQGLEGDKSLRLGDARKLRLFSCAAAMLRWHDLCLVAQGCVEVAMRYADGTASDEDRGVAFRRAKALRDHEGTLARACLFPDAPRAAYDLTWELSGNDDGEMHRRWSALLRDIVGNPYRTLGLTDADYVTEALETWPEGGGITRSSVRWHTPQVKSLAVAAYAEPLPDGTLDPFRLALIADALEEAGCAKDELLFHLRGEEGCPHCEGAGRVETPGDWVPCGRCDGTGMRQLTHVRGCWAVDLLADKELK